MRIRFSWPDGQIEGELKDTPTVAAVVKAFPHTASANTWGEEVYFDVGVPVSGETDARQVVDPGTICYWMQGSCIALPYGPTPISEGNECRLASECNIMGKLDGDPRALASVRSGDSITVELVTE